MDIKKFAAAKLLEAKRRKWKNRYNLIMMCILTFFIVGYGFFFTSKLWYNDDSNMAIPTKINSVRSWHNRDVQLLDWTYAPNANMMEIQIKMADKSHDGIEAFTYRAYVRNGGYLPTEAIIQQDGLYIIHVTEIPKDWSDMAFFIDYPGSETDYCKLLTNDKSVAQVDNIEEHTYNEYMQINLDNQIAFYNEKIEALQQDIVNQEELISDYEINIQKYEARKLYQTQMEQRETDRLISEEQTMKAAAENAINSDNATIEEYQERIRLLNEEKNLYQ